jgi:hypothetical protein
MSAISRRTRRDQQRAKKEVGKPVKQFHFVETAGPLDERSSSTEAIKPTCSSLSAKSLDKRAPPHVSAAHDPA